MRIGLICPYDLSKPGGVQTQVLGLSRVLADLGEAPLVLGPGLPPGVQGVDLGPTVSIPANGSLAPVSLLPSAASTIRRSVDDLDLLHVHEPLVPMVSLAALRSGPPVVATFHAAPGRLGRGLYRSLGRRLRSVLGPATRVVTSVSAVAAAALPEDLDVRLVPNGVDVSALAVDVPRSVTRVVFLARDEPRKGLDVLLAAWSQVVEAAPDAELVVMGCRRPVSGVKWMGEVDDDIKAEVLSSAAVFVAPNLGGESFGITLVEAMAAGAAVVASDLEAFREVAGDAALFFEPGDAGALAEAVTELLLDDSKREAVAEIGRLRASRYDWPVVAADYRRAYLDAIV
jgi:phosphatidylinositol alpha-mannosyltransferase